MDNAYNAITPSEEVTTTSTPNAVNIENALPELSEDEIRVILSRRQNPELAAKMDKVLDKSDAETASAVRGKVMEALDNAVIDAMLRIFDSEDDSYIADSQEYVKKVGKITITAEIEEDGKLKVATKSPRRKQATTN